MLQDLPGGRLLNEFRDPSPKPEDVIVCFRDGKILLHRDANEQLRLPQLGEADTTGWNAWCKQPLRYAFRLQEEDYFLYLGEPEAFKEYAWEPVRTLRQLESKEVCFAVMTAWHLYCWYRSNRFCGCCGTPTRHDKNERMLRCDNCGNMIFPKICPVVIVAVTDGDRLLLSKYAGRAYTRYALLAGYTEIGETLEQTVAREVMEEVGVKVKNLRYYKSQPWGVDGNVLMGFFCDLDGDGTIHLDEKELAMADWYDRNNLPAHDDGISLTREMIRVFEEGREPK